MSEVGGYLSAAGQKQTEAGSNSIASGFIHKDALPQKSILEKSESNDPRIHNP